MGLEKRRRGRPVKEPANAGRVALGLRVTPEVKRKLDGAAERSGRSQSQEAELRLERSFDEEDAFGGPELRRIAHLMAIAFANAGSLHAHPRPASEWVHDPDAYVYAAMRVVETLLLQQPGLTIERLALQLEALRGRLLTGLIEKAS